MLPGVDGDDHAAVGNAFQELVDVLAEAAELAPEEITADVALVAGGMSRSTPRWPRSTTTSTRWRPSAAGSEVLEAVNAPAFTDAGSRLAAYRVQVCDL